MKQPKKPTYNQKKFLAGKGLKWREWMVRSEDAVCMTVIHKSTGEIKHICK